MSWTFDQIEREWLAGSRIAVDPADIIAAFNRCERVLGRDWIDLAHRGSVEGVRITGAGPTFRVVSIGLSLASLDDVADSQQLINRIRSGDQSADAELRAIQLLRSEDPARRVELDPTVDENRKCDFRIKRGSEAWVYVEVTRPDTSNAQYRVQMVLQSICDQVASVNRPFALEVFLRREPSDVELDTVSAAALDLCSVDQPADRVIRTEMPDGIGLFILNQHATSQVVLDDHGEEKVPRLGMSKAIIGLGQPNRHVVVRMPFADQRAERFLTTEAKQLPSNAPGLVMVEMEGAPGGFQSWDATIRRRFQPAMHTRVGGVALFSPGLVPTYHGVASVLRTKLITNPYAKLSLPEWIESTIAAPGERYERLVHQAAAQTRPVLDRDGAVVLYDMYVITNGAPKWIGSRRTLEQCQDSFDAYFRSFPLRDRK